MTRPEPPAAEAAAELTAAGLVVDWEGVRSLPGHDASAVARRLGRLRGHAVHLALLGEAGGSGLERVLGGRPDGAGQTAWFGPVDSELARPAAAALTWLGSLGLGPGLVALLLGAGRDSQALRGRLGELVPGAARATVLQLDHGDGLVAALDGLLRHMAHRRAPSVDDDPDWVITETGTDVLRHRITESLFTLASGGMAVRGTVEEDGTGTVPMVLAAGVYTGRGPEEHLQPGPLWGALGIAPPPAGDVRTLDLRTGVLARRAADLASVRFASAAVPGTAAMRVEGRVGSLTPTPVLLLPEGGDGDQGRDAGVDWARTGPRDAGGMAVAATQRLGRENGRRTVERLVACASNPYNPPHLDTLLAQAHRLREVGFDRALAAHRAAWAARWDRVDVEIPDDPEAQKALRFALFQLWNHTGRHDELALGARGLTGAAYAGHVFWDADVFMLPALVTIDPASARAMVLYRLNRLRAARSRADGAGRAGARFPWESASDGYDVTPTAGFLGGRRVPVLTGSQEEHITADVAWAADFYATWTGDTSFVAGVGRPLVVESARYWTSRCSVDDRGLAHIQGVIGPDEYHESVDDNAFTNVLARWNLTRAADIVEAEFGATAETTGWRALSRQLVDNLDPASGLYEQFSGFHQLEPLVAADIAAVPFAGDVLLGPERLARSQLIKQPDVLMLHFMLPDHVAPGSLDSNLDFYLPRTVHGSSLSPAVSASLLARAGRPDEGYDLFRVALELDLHDETGLTAAGLHLATLGGVWQAMLRGFLGARVRAGVLELDPRLPTRWERVAVRFGCLGRRVRVGVTPDQVVVETDGPLQVGLEGSGAQVVDGRAVLAREGKRETR